MDKLIDRKVIGWILWGAGSLLLISLSIASLTCYDGQMGEFILYGFTVLWVLCGIFRRQAERFFRTKAGKITKYVIGIYLIINAAVIIFLQFACRTDEVTFEEPYCIVLGAPVHATRGSELITERINTAADFLTQDEEALVVVTGGKSIYDDMGDDVAAATSEAGYMAMFLIADGIDPDRIYMEDSALTTLDNFKYSIDLLAEAGYTQGDEVVIITNVFHSYRVRRIAGKAGIENFKIYGAPLPFYQRVVWYLREVPATILEWIIQ